MPSSSALACFSQCCWVSAMCSFISSATCSGSCMATAARIALCSFASSSCEPGAVLRRARSWRPMSSDQRPSSTRTNCSLRVVRASWMWNSRLVSCASREVEATNCEATISSSTCTSSAVARSVASRAKPGSRISRSSSRSSTASSRNDATKNPRFALNSTSSSAVSRCSASRTDVREIASASARSPCRRRVLGPSSPSSISVLIRRYATSTTDPGLIGSSVRGFASMRRRSLADRVDEC